ncbi:hypothetical protein [Anabaena sp. 4-3]|nr:hypothetical protein [Anabaena sp. 4-3]
MMSFADGAMRLELSAWRTFILVRSDQPTPTGKQAMGSVSLQQLQPLINR